jgi:nucleotide-binding universal stress UspA family protein
MTADGVPAPVVVAIGGDGSSGSDAPGSAAPGSEALDWGAAEAAARGAPLRVVHAVPAQLWTDPCGLMAAGSLRSATLAASRSVEAALARARRVAPEVPSSGHVLPGTPARVLVQHSREAALLVLGGRRRSSADGRADVLRARVTARSDCPVVVVRARPVGAGASGPPRVVVGVDSARSCIPALGFAFQAAAQRGIPLTAVHTWSRDTPADLEGACAAPAVTEAEARDTLDRVLDRWWHTFPDVPVQRRVSCSEPAGTLLAAARGAALVVVGSRGRGPVRSRLFGSVSWTVAQHSVSPVAVVGSDCPLPAAAVPQEYGDAHRRPAPPPRTGRARDGTTPWE